MVFSNGVMAHAFVLKLIQMTDFVRTVLFMDLAVEKIFFGGKITVTNRQFSAFYR